jgi:hypothetical protein
MVHHAPALGTADSMLGVVPIRAARAASAMDEVVR